MIPTTSPAGITYCPSMACHVVVSAVAGTFAKRLSAIAPAELRVRANSDTCPAVGSAPTTRTRARRSHVCPGAATVCSAGRIAPADPAAVCCATWPPCAAVDEATTTKACPLVVHPVRLPSSKLQLAPRTFPAPCAAAEAAALAWSAASCAECARARASALALLAPLAMVIAPAASARAASSRVSAAARSVTAWVTVGLSASKSARFASMAAVIVASMSSDTSGAGVTAAEYADHDEAFPERSTARAR